MKSKPVLIVSVVLAGAALAAAPVMADNKVEVNAKGVTAIATDGNTSSVTIGGIGSGAEVEGVSVINDKVYIDGKEIPANVKRYKSKNGTIYRIDRKGNSVDVHTEEGKRR